MNIVKRGGGMISILLSEDELRTINNALNEVCNGVHIDEADFQTRLGVNRDEALAILAEIAQSPDRNSGRRSESGCDPRRIHRPYRDVRRVG